MDIEKWLGYVSEALEKMADGDEFELSCILDAYGWSELPPGIRSNFGRIFSNLVGTGAFSLVCKSENSKNNHRFYVKTHFK